ncbi:MAG: Cell wall surface anchor family protein [candidate division TM6 bacterium GW2011_GWE2_42_60]|nr:MAG: Cell wall surface anchor family protein [candidate division TM6 bacterium GW2011_GWE2_42_60]
MDQKCQSTLAGLLGKYLVVCGLALGLLPQQFFAEEALTVQDINKARALNLSNERIDCSLHRDALTTIFDAAALLADDQTAQSLAGFSRALKTSDTQPHAIELSYALKNAVAVLENYGDHTENSVAEGILLNKARQYLTLYSVRAPRPDAPTQVSTDSELYPVPHDTNVYGDLYVGGTFTANDIALTGDLNVPGNINATGTVSAGNIAVSGDFNVPGTLTVGNFTLTGDLNVPGDINATGTVNAASIALSGDLNVPGTLTAGDFTLLGDLHVPGNLSVDGTTTVNDTNVVDGILAVKQTVGSKQLDIGINGEGTAPDGYLGTRTATSFVMKASSTSGAITFEPLTNNITLSAASAGTVSFDPASGTIAINQSISTTSAPSFTGVTLANQGQLKLYEATGGGTDFVALQAPAALGASYTLTLPTTAGTNGYALTTNGSGVLGWSPFAAGSYFANGGNSFGVASAIRITIANSAGSGLVTVPSALYADGGIDVTATGGTDVLNLGVTNADTINLGTATTTQLINIGTGAGVTTINIGGTGDTVNIGGTLTWVKTTDLQVTDKLITINKDGALASGDDAGIQIEENAVNTAYAKTGNTRASWLLKAPATAGIVTITPGASGFTLNQGVATTDSPSFVGLTLSGMTTAGVVHNAVTTGVLSSSLIVNADVDASAGIVDTKLATIATAGKVSNSATTATAANTASAIVARDASGDFAARYITLSQDIFKDSGSNTITMAAPSTVTASYSLTLPVAVPTANNQVLAGSTAGALSWVTAALNGGNTLGAALTLGTLDAQALNLVTGTTGPNTRLSIDATGAIAIPAFTTAGVVHNAITTGVLSSSLIVNADVDAAAGIVDTKLATIATAGKVSNSATTATAANTASAIVARDASGDFAARYITLSQDIFKDSGSNTITMAAPSTVTASYSLTLPVAVPGGDDYALTAKTTGVSSWSSVALSGGNTLGAALTLGTTDAYALNLKANNKTGLSIDSSGNTTYASKYKAAAYVGANITPPLAADVTTVVFGTENYDYNSNYVNTTGIYTAPVTGLYLVTAQVCAQIGEVGAKEIGLFLNGTAAVIPGAQAKIVVPTIISSDSGTDTRMLNFTTMVALTAADTIQVRYTGDTLDTIFADSSSFAVHYMSFTPA